MSDSVYGVDSVKHISPWQRSDQLPILSPICVAKFMRLCTLRSNFNAVMFRNGAD